MNPFYFGDSASPLFGVHTPARGTASKGSIVLCYPMGAEYMRAHRAYRQLTHLLSRAGFDVLRFDYSHTGDSAGDAIDSTLAGWIQDLGTAIEEMKEMTGDAEVSLAGLRMGAAIAATAAAARDDIRHLVLWDPVVRGDAYAADLRLAADSALESTNGKGPTLGVAGFPISPDLLAEVTAVDLLGLADRMPSADVVVSESRPEYEEMLKALEQKRPDTRMVVRPTPNNWMEGDAFGSALIPSPIIEAIVQMCTTSIPATSGGRR